METKCPVLVPGNNQRAHFASEKIRFRDSVGEKIRISGRCVPCFFTLDSPSVGRSNPLLPVCVAICLQEEIAGDYIAVLLLWGQGHGMATQTSNVNVANVEPASVKQYLCERLC